MATPVEAPKLGNTVEEVLIARWAKRKGEAVAAGELIAEIETDKATFEVTAPVAGTLLETFFENHDPTQGMRQGNDVGTQYRSGIYVTTPPQRAAAAAAKAMYQTAIAAKGYGNITTEIRDAPPFYFAEDYHQQYLARNPFGYCSLGGTGVSCPIATGTAAAR